MFLGVTFLVLFTRHPYEIHSLRACVPNTYIALNDRLCLCDLHGRLNEANCKIIARREACLPGQVSWQGCNHCICQDNGQLKCTSGFCTNRVTNSRTNYRSLAEYDPRCTPFMSYYVNCSLCLCPASGQASDAQCAVDASCSLDQTSDITTITKRNQCIPNVMYLFPCLQCLCSEYGHFLLDQCLEKCHQTKHRRRCIPGTLYRRNCDVCRCPDNSLPDEKLCINGCNANTKHTYLHSLRSSPKRCIPRTFTKPKCIYCDCSLEGTVNEHSCLELDCSKISDFKVIAEIEVCSPGELVPICMECFCLNNGLTNETYCTRACSYQSKLNILQKVLNDSKVDIDLIDNSKIKTIERNQACEPNTLYIDSGKYCLCSDNDDTKFKFCTNVIDDLKFKNVESNYLKFDTTVNCEPSTLVDFDCNTCYCSKSGKIDPKWCTYDDCEAKRIVMETHKTLAHSDAKDMENPSGVCTPGSISKVKCNFCICPDSGILRERACTKNDCFDNVEVANEKFICEPLAYYEVDCNICFCPRDGLKNVAKCTKNQCEKSFLRSEACISGHLFSDECNVCVCPPDGNKADRVCTNNTCNLPQWRTFKLTADSFIENELHDDATRNLDLCYPGEEFSMGCNVCICPDLGLKIYALCEPILCDEKEGLTNDGILDRMGKMDETNRTIISYRNLASRTKRELQEKCFIYNMTHSAERQDCSPGSMYIVRCKQCICPYVGNINSFCRPLPKSFYCEEAFPGFNFLAMGRRTDGKNNITERNPKTMKESITVTVKHSQHTIYKCDKSGKIMDECFICECEDNMVIKEHCFKSDAKNCSDATPTFFDANKVIGV